MGLHCNHLAYQNLKEVITQQQQPALQENMLDLWVNPAPAPSFRALEVETRRRSWYHGNSMTVTGTAGRKAVPLLRASFESQSNDELFKTMHSRATSVRDICVLSHDRI